MPLFADLAAMQARFEERDLIQLSDAGNTGAIVASVIEDKLSSADALIISYVAARHGDAAALAGNALLTDIACDYAFSLLWRSDPPEWVLMRRKDAVRRLEDISKGVIKLDSGTEEAAPRPGQIRITSDPQRLSRTSLEGY
ncbi:phage protein Gp36 family protein [Novosphingobium naphthalenivorans]|uniref:phage protein Gp36 family protein n=1 Tax=Novosphingobium naphthalenivorans TaxID=273168 RepID=UPI000833DAA4|nr:phage protein Gp36 family protein [Novosphingobium naphthalenivorans]